MSGVTATARDERGLEAVKRLVERVARAYEAGSTLIDADPGGPPPAGRADLVVSFDAATRAGDWRGRLKSLAGQASKVLVVVGPNPDRVQLGAVAQLAGGREVADVAGLLWELGRVREHAYLVFPRAVEVLAAVRGSLAEPDVARAPVGALVRRTARLHAFVVDLAPRTPQARRRLRAVDAS
jgi:hypothetical protein